MSQSVSEWGVSKSIEPFDVAHDALGRTLQQLHRAPRSPKVAEVTGGNSAIGCLFVLAKHLFSMCFSVPRRAKVTEVAEIAGIAGRRCVFSSSGHHDGAKRTDRTEEDSAPVLFAVVPSLCFHIVFLAEWTDWTDRTGITSGRGVRTAASCISSREP
jgi:hypothetical protein